MARLDPRMLKPFTYIGRKCTAGLNLTTKVRTKRINKEVMRQKLAKAKFVSAPRLLKNNQIVKVYLKTA